MSKDKIEITHTCGGKMIIDDWHTEWTHDVDDTLVLVFVCEKCEKVIEVRY